MKLNFTSLRDTKGYEIVGKMRFRRAGRHDFRENVDGPLVSGHIVGKGGKMERVRLSDWPQAYEDFAKIKTDTDLLKFVTNYGPLTYSPTKVHATVFLQVDGQAPVPLETSADEVVLLLLDEAAQMRECMQGRGREVKPYSRILSARLYKTEAGEKGIEMTPSTLLDALWLQFHDTESSGAVFRECPYCKGPFAAGGNSGRRSIAEFCSEEHRKRFNSLARSNPKLRERRK